MCVDLLNWGFGGEQIEELNYQGYEIILVASGAVGVGRQRLRYRRLVNSRFNSVSGIY